MHKLFHFAQEEGADAVCADVFDGGDELALSEDVGPGVFYLADEAFVFARAGEFVEGGGGLGGEDEGKRAGGYRIGQFDGDEFDSDVAEGLEGSAFEILGLSDAGLERFVLDVGGAVLVEEGGDIADAEGANVPRVWPVEGAIDNGVVEPVGSADGVEDQGAVFDGAGNGADFVHRP